MSAEEARAYIDRWKAVAEIEQRELQAATIQEKWRQLNAIKRLADGLGITREDDDGKMEVYLRWAKLKRLYEAGITVTEGQIADRL
ncbi:MAG: hypothetical protein KBG20_04390 [Caldilineaceae bacterium]|nr:hypothetical protein [Caldilineaceae bacterium]MBP8106806.1 hypothetical protein [Caldilineaceae bacterium]MBP8121700.1 hypothetical protein [Caldilineaceae bacterium]MBP9071510.1 hypothetical protein [Caldilineaceae bacterium]